jgi:hypothetical protein
MSRLDPCAKLDFYDAPSMGVTIYIPAACFSLLGAIFFYEKFGVAVAAASVFVIFLLFQNWRKRILVSMRIQGDSIELVALGGRHALKIDQIESCAICGIRLAFTIFIVIRINGRFPIFFQACAMSTNSGGYMESNKQLKLMIQSAKSGLCR